MSDSYQIKEHKAIALPAGIYAPIPTAFKEDEAVDVQATVRHALRLAKAGVGLVVSGSTGEAIALTNAERAQLVYEIRLALTKSNDEQAARTPIIAGTGSGSLRETIALCHEAYRAGADAVIVIAPGYFSMSIAQDRHALKDFFSRCADESPLPVMVYNFPAAAGGIDLDSELLEEIAAHPNICGAKLTCAGVGKVGRLANSSSVGQREPFHVFPGFADILFPCMMIGSTGAIVGTANIIPRFCVKHFNDIVHFQREPTKELLKAIQGDQDVLSRFDRALSKYGVVATKYALSRFFYPQGPPRKPLQPIDEARIGKDLQEALLSGLQREQKLENEAGVTVDKINL